MGNIRKNPPMVHPFAALMFPNENLHKQAMELLTTKFGEPLGIGEEFGWQLQKQFIVYKKPASLETLYKTKIWSNEVELSIKEPENNKRFVNIDPGYLEASKFVLYSSKDFSHRLYQAEGVFAEVTMLFMHGKFHKMDWTYEDYWNEKNRNFLIKMRSEIVRLAREKLQK